MSAEEREYMKEIDSKILNASEKTLKRLQEIDLKTQLDGMTFYDAYSNSKSTNSEKSTSEIPSLRKSKRS